MLPVCSQHFHAVEGRWCCRSVHNISMPLRAAGAATAAGAAAFSILNVWVFLSFFNGL